MVIPILGEFLSAGSGSRELACLLSAAFSGDVLRVGEQRRGAGGLGLSEGRSLGIGRNPRLSPGACDGPLGEELSPLVLG